MPNPITLSAQSLSRRFGTRTVVKEISLQLERGQVLGLLGTNGAGKSTTLRMLTGNLAPSSGSVNICGHDLLKQPKPAKSRLGYLPEIPPLYPELTVNEYLTLAARLRRIEKSKIASAVEVAKQKCQLEQVATRIIGKLSRGLQQRVGIAQAIVHDPEIVILDEPTIGLDPNQIRHLRSVIREIGNKRSVILSTHILRDVEATCDRVEILHDGVIIHSSQINPVTDLDDCAVVGLARPPLISELSTLPGVIRVVSLPRNFFRVHFSPEKNPISGLIAKSVENDWGLFQLSPHKGDLENLFVQLTQPDYAV